MNQNQFRKEGPSSNRPQESNQLKRFKSAFSSFGAIGGLVGGIVCCLIGSLLTAFAWLGFGPQFAAMHTVGTVLLALTVPLIVLGAYSLDLQERLDGKTRTRFGGRRRGLPCALAVVFALGFCSTHSANAQSPSVTEPEPEVSAKPEKRAEPDAVATGGNTIPRASDAAERERLLLERIEKLEKRLSELEKRAAVSTPEAGPLEVVSARTESTSEAPAPTRNILDAHPPGPAAKGQVSEEDRSVLDFLRDTTINFTIDGYYGYNFNRPVGGVNVLRAYDVMSNSFSLNQAAVIIEQAPNVEKGRRFGGRLDLQFGQATETVQGNAANEPRPQVYRHVWQAYGTYVAPVGKGLTVDFGKWSSALGYETNYTKDNFNYSRSYFFNFLPFYHMGFRSTYAFNDKVTLSHWLVNGTQQSEDFNGFKSQALLLTYKPTARITSQFNYYNGQEQRDRSPALNPTFAPVASQPGLSIDVIRPVPSGRLHILDTYHTFNVTYKLTLAVEGDYVNGRVFRDSPPSTVWGGVGYARYQWTPKFAVAGRFEYLNERVSPAGGLFSGVSQALKEHTLTAEYKFTDGFLTRAEYRRDFSNQPFFLTEQPGLFKKEQNTVTLGLVWWFGRKQGTW